MRYVRILIPTMCLFAGLAAGQKAPLPVAPPPAPPVPKIAPLPPVPPDVDAKLKSELDQERLLLLKERAMDASSGADFAAQKAELEAEMAAIKASADRWRVAEFNFAPREAEFEAQIAQLKASSDRLVSGFAFAPQKFNPSQSEDRQYESGQRALEGRRWDDALEAFNQVAAKAGNRADGAWFWKAYTLRKLGRRDDALAAIAELRKSYPNSRWLDDAKALELEVRQASGQNVAPESESDEELKLMALNGLMRSDPDRALPILETLLKSAQSPRLKRNAVFVLAQSDLPKASQLLEQVARGGSNPDLQITAIRYLGEKRRQSNGPQILADIYNSSSDVNVKRAVLSSLANSRDKDRLLQIAKTEKNQDLRLDAIRYVGSNSAAQAELWQLYQSETAPEIRRQILQSMPFSGNADKLLEVAKTEKDPNLRRFAIQSLASQRAASTSDGLVSLYGSEQDPNIRRTIMDALYGQRNAKALVQLARNEHDFKMKQQLVERLSSMKAPEATEYLMEILK